MPDKKKRGAAPGENRFKKSQEKLVRLTAEEIRVVIEQLRRSRLTFRNVTHLASYVADVITERRGASSKRMAPSTLLRTAAYRAKLDGYLVSAGGKSGDEKLSRLAAELELNELEELRAENIRLTQYIAKHMGGVSESSPRRVQSDSMQVIDQLCRAISLLLEASTGQIVIDPERGEIVNAWAKSKKNRIVVPAAISKPYLDWHNSFPTMGGKYKE